MSRIDGAPSARPRPSLIPGSSSGRSPDQRALAYPLPLVLDRSRAPRYRLVNVGDEELGWVRLRVDGPGVMPLSPPLRLDPGRSREVVVHSADPERNVRLQVSWRRPNGQSYLWSFVL
ncbi:hypothetical protein [Mycetocola reblochoni]|uniref:Uncharacterized protein n=2 Tax=Mycetocola reblochoni TaxID=331618 RepID=A0A1R4IWY3_9MICO|nr:hypothetical protein [Mycetocola reblochoni]RLP70939.1 hypothetical protein D9V30_00460 [Mycetocola reblochoni]SJN24352.1 hypothetical protein FM119_04175 [Mycetocola reblochoni REB411]